MTLTLTFGITTNNATTQPGTYPAGKYSLHDCQGKDGTFGQQISSGYRSVQS